MSKDPAFLFYPNDYIGGTMGMTFEEKGAYIELLMLQFNRGHMTIHMIGHAIGQLWDNIQDKFKVDENGLYYNARLELEISNRKNYVQSRHNNRSGVNQYTKKEVTESGHMTNHTTGRMEDENEDVNVNVINVMEVNETEPKQQTKTTDIDDFFESIWKLYPNKLGKGAVKQRQKHKLYLIGFETLSKCIERYVSSKEDWKKYKDGSTFFNGGYIDFLDENFVDEKKTSSTPRKTASGGYQM